MTKMFAFRLSDAEEQMFEKMIDQLETQSDIRVSQAQAAKSIFYFAFDRCKDLKLRSNEPRKRRNLSEKMKMQDHIEAMQMQMQILIEAVKGKSNG